MTGPAEHGMRTVHVNGTDLAYVERGSGEPVVLVHGTLGDARSWEPQLDAFGARYRTIAYSRRHHHPNRCGAGGPGYSAELHADDLAVLIDRCGAAPAHVVGNSYGAYTALLLAARHPEAVRTLVLGEPPALPVLEHHTEGRELRDQFFAEVWDPGGELLRQGRVEDGIGVFVDALFGEGAYRQLEPEVHALLLDNAPAFRLETSSPDFWTPFTEQDARRVTAPTLLLSGERSLRMFQLVVSELARWIPDSEHVEIAGSSHDLPSHDVEAFRHIVLGFLARHAGAARG